MVESTEEATAESTEAVVVESTEEATVESTQEVAIESSPEATAEVTEAAVESTEEPAAESTEEVIVESTAEATAEVTQEAVAESTEEPNPESTEEPGPAEPITQTLLSADFESELSGWSASESAQIVTMDDGNSALLLNGGDSLTSDEPLDAATIDFTGRVNFQAVTPGSFDLQFRSSETDRYILSVGLTHTTLLRQSGEDIVELVSVPAERSENTWYSIHLNAVNGDILVEVDGETVLSYQDETPLETGSVSLLADGETSFYLDDLLLVALLQPDLITTPTPLPTYELNEENGAKLTDALYQVLSLLQDGDQEGALELAASTGIEVLDDNLTVEVVVWPTAAGDTDSIVPVVAMAGGTVTTVDEKNLTIQIALPDLIPVISAEEVLAVRLPQVAVPTDSTLSAAAAPAQAGESSPATANVIGWNDWNAQSITGSGVKIAVIDTGDITHRNNIDYLLGYFTPGASVQHYTAINATQMATAIQSARTADKDVILITEDLGANVSPGDGTGSNGSGMGSADSLYSQIAAARAEGRLVIASAGNNTGRYISFQHTTPGTVVSMSLEAGDYVVNVVWDDWDGTPDLNVASTLTGGGITNRTSPSRVDAPSYQYTGTCSAGAAPCSVSLNFSGNTGRYVQVQLNSPGEITGITGSAEDTNAGNIARPADSPDVLTVGAVCPRQLLPRYQPLVDSSHGPIFQDGGGGSGPDSVTGTRSDYKPDIAAPSHVYTSTAGAPDDNCQNYNTPTGGFNGTSAAATHTAAMAALLLSNPGMTAEIANASNPADAVQDYLQSHVIDLDTAASDAFAADLGFDNVYGSGLSTLGDPNYDLSQVFNPPISGTGAIYVGAGNLDSAMDGTGANPYIHPSEALAAAGPGDRIVFMPGEYIADFIVDSVDSVSFVGMNHLASFWVNDTYDGKAGILVQQSTAFTIEGFNFSSANPIESGSSYVYTTTGIIGVMFNSPGATESAGGGIIRDSTFSNFLSDYPIQIIRTTGVNIFDNVFDTINTSANYSDATAIYIYDADLSTDRILIQGNTFRNVHGADDSANPSRNAVIYIWQAKVDVYANYFNNNNTESVISVVNTKNDGTEAVTVFSNIFAVNKNLALFMNNAPDTQFVNNTVADQVAVNDDKEIILRSGGTDASPFAVHNNLFFNNRDNDYVSGVNVYRVIEHKNFSGGLFPLCRSIDQPSTNETGARNNWVINSQSDFSTGTCDKSFRVSGADQNNNIVSPGAQNAVDIFVGANPSAPLDPDTDPYYYQILNSALGVDGGDPALIAGFDPYVDFPGNPRATDGDSMNGDEPDMGGFEVTPLSTSPILESRFEDVFDQVNDRVTAFAIDLTDGVNGGIPPFSFKLKSLPINYSTDTTDFCGGQGLVIQGKFAYYCPPRNFYTDSTDSPDVIPDNIYFEFYAFDQLGDPNNVSTGVEDTVTLRHHPNRRPAAERSNQHAVDPGSGRGLRLQDAAFGLLQQLLLLRSGHEPPERG